MPAHSKVFDPRTVQRGVRRAEPGDIWSRLNHWATIGVALFLVAITALLYLPVIRKHQVKLKQKNELLQLIQLEEARSVQLQNRLHRLQGDPVYIERVARDVLNYGRQGETIFRFEPLGD